MLEMQHYAILSSNDECFTSPQNKNKVFVSLQASEHLKKKTDVLVTP